MIFIYKVTKMGDGINFLFAILIAFAIYLVFYRSSRFSFGNVEPITWSMLVDRDIRFANEKEWAKQLGL